MTKSYMGKHIREERPGFYDKRIEVKRKYKLVGDRLRIEHLNADVKNKEQHDIHSNNDGKRAVSFKLGFYVLDERHNA